MSVGSCAIEVREDSDKLPIILYLYQRKPRAIASLIETAFIKNRNKSIDMVATFLIDEFDFKPVKNLNRKSINYYYELVIRKNLDWTLTMYKKQEDGRFKRFYTIPIPSLNYKF